MHRCVKKNKISLHQIYETSHVDGSFVNVLDYDFSQFLRLPFKCCQGQERGGQGTELAQMPLSWLVFMLFPILI